MTTTHGRTHCTLKLPGTSADVLFKIVHPLRHTFTRLYSLLYCCGTRVLATPWHMKGRWWWDCYAYFALPPSRASSESPLPAG
jgi:hypothetical protein